KRRCRNTKRHIVWIREVRLGEDTTAGVWPTGDRKEPADFPIAKVPGLELEPHDANGTVRLEKGRDLVPSPVRLGHSQLRVPRWAGSANRGLGMAPRTTRSVEARAEATGLVK